jgi:hypothetical protein
VRLFSFCIDKTENYGILLIEEKRDDIHSST